MVDKSNRLLLFLTEELKRMDTDHSKRVTAWNKWHKQFRGVVDETKSSAKSRLFIQRTKVACMSGVANVIDILFPSDDFFDVMGRNDPDVRGAELTKKVVAWALKQGRFFRETVLYAMQAVIYGTAFAKVVPYTIKELAPLKLPITLVPGSLEKIGMRTEFIKQSINLARIELVDIFDVWVDPAATTVENASGLFHRCRRTLNYLKEQEKLGRYQNVDDVERLVTAKKGASKSQDSRRTNVGLPPVDYGKESIEIYEYWGKIPAELAKEYQIEVKDDEFEVEAICTLAEKDVVLRAERNTMPGQMRFFISDVWEPSGDKSLYGRGIPENVRGSQQALNVTVNLRLDNKAWAIAAPLVVNIDKIEDTSDLQARVNWVIRGKGGTPNEIAQFAQIPDMTGNSISEAQEFERHIDEESGMNKAVQATQSFGSNRTFGGISLAYSAAARPVRLIAKGFEDNLISQGLKLMFVMLLTTLDEKLKIRITDDEGAPEYLTADPLAMALDVDFIASGSFAMTQRDQVVQSMTSWFDSLSKIPALAERPEWDWKWMAQKFYEAIGLKDFHKAWNDQNAQPPAMPGAEQGAAAGGGGDVMAQLAAMMGGQGGQAEAGGIPGAGAEGLPEGNGAIELLAQIGRMVGGGTQ